MQNKTRNMIILLVVAIMLGKTAYSITYHKNLNRFEQGIQDGVLTMTKVFSAPIVYTKNIIKKANNCQSYNNDSVSLNTELYIQEQNNTIKELSDLLEIESKINTHIINSNIVTYNNINQTLIINKGENQGIKKDFLVINQEGLIGYVANCSKNYSTVNLLPAVKNFRKMSVKVQTTNQSYGILSSFDNQKKLYILEGVTNSDELSIGSLVTTSGINNNEPSGILIGYIESFISGQNGLETKIYVRPVSKQVNYAIVGVLSND